MSYDLLSESKPKAKKEHKCIWCGETILVGETYQRENSVYCGDMQYHKWHLECRAAANEYFRVSHEDEFDPWENERPSTRLGFANVMDEGQRTPASESTANEP